MWRDFWKFWVLDYGEKPFNEYGVYDRSNKPWEPNKDGLVERWCQGMTGMPIIDAIMRELNQTGFASNRAR